MTVETTKEDGSTERQTAVKHTVYRNFTNLYSVGPSPYMEDALLIWLNYAMPKEE